MNYIYINVKPIREAIMESPLMPDCIKGRIEPEAIIPYLVSAAGDDKDAYGAIYDYIFDNLPDNAIYDVNHSVEIDNYIQSLIRISTDYLISEVGSIEVLDTAWFKCYHGPNRVILEREE